MARRTVDTPPGLPVAAPIQAVIFDLDGTLVDHIGSATAALRAWLPTMGVTPTSELVDAWFAAEERHFPAWRKRQVTFVEQRRRRLRDFLPLLGITPQDDESLDLLFADYLTRYEASWTKFDDVDGALAGLAEPALKIAVLSNGTAAQQNALHVGDRHDLDVLAPRAAGLQALYLDRTDRGPYDESERITSLDKLSPWLTFRCIPT